MCLTDLERALAFCMLSELPWVLQGLVILSEMRHSKRLDRQLHSTLQHALNRLFSCVPISESFPIAAQSIAF